jgi:carbamoyltransferase
MRIIGISAFYHDSAVCLVVDGRIVFAAQEERYSRIKHDPSFPVLALADCLRLHPGEVDAVVYYERPLLKFERLLEGIIQDAPRSYGRFMRSMPVWAAQKLLMRRQIRKGLKDAGMHGHGKVRILFTDHHLSHAASAFLPGPFREAAILTIDGVGEHATATIAHGRGHEIEMLAQMRYPHSLGLLYSAFTYFLGFRVNEGEYKVMGLAPYGIPGSEQVERFERLIHEQLATLHDDGSLTLNDRHFAFNHSEKMIPDADWVELFGFARRATDAEIGQHHCDLALAIQLFTEKVVIQMALHAKRMTGCDHLCMAGGVALNCVANARLRDSGIFKDIWIQPAAGDAGGALGAALWADSRLRGARCFNDGTDAMQGARLGDLPDGDEGIPRAAVFTTMPDDDALCREVASILTRGETVGWVQGRMEFGPRALGGRSILADPRLGSMQRDLNLKVKFRESFRPFAPAVTEEAAWQWFIQGKSCPYMLFTSQMRPDILLGSLEREGNMTEKLAHVPGPVAAVTHVDGSARVQTVSAQSDPLFHALLSAFGERTGVPMLVNTSFNLRDEPIVRTPADAYRTFMRCGLDVLVVGHRIYRKADQPAFIDSPAPVPPVPRQAWYSLLAVAVAMALFIYRLGPVWLYAVPVAVVIAASFSSFLQRYVHNAWMGLAHLLGRINGSVLLTVAYGFLIVPIRALTREKKSESGFLPMPKRATEQEWGAY